MNDPKDEQPTRLYPGSSLLNRLVHSVLVAEEAKKKATGDANIKLTADERKKALDEGMEQWNRENPLVQKPKLSEEEQAIADAELDAQTKEAERQMAFLVKRRQEQQQQQ